MDIGKEGKPFVIEPLVEPVPGREREPVPEPDYEPVHTIVGFALLWVAVMVVCSFGARR